MSACRHLTDIYKLLLSLIIIKGKRKMKTLKKLSAIFLAVTVLLGCFITGVSAAEENDQMLKFKDGKFKILVLSDIQDTNTPQKETLALMKAAIDEAKPDFIALTGDNTAGWWKGVDAEQTKTAIDIIAKEINDRKIPFALVFGNHDHEGLSDENNKLTEREAKKLMLSWYQEYEYCLAVEGEEMTGIGNYNLLVKDSAGEKDIFNMWFMDSNPYSTEEEGGGYGYIHKDQIEWYEKTSNELKEANGGKPVPSLVFQHIVVPEVYEMFTEVKFGTKGSVHGNANHTKQFYIANPEFVYEGHLNEGPCPANTANDGQFDSWLKQGDVIGAFFGHDHINDFAGTYKGIKLVAVPAVTFYSYGNYRGARTITLDENDLTDFESEVLTFDQLLPDLKVRNLYKANHGYIEYKNNFLPIAGGVLGGGAVLAAAVTFLVKYLKKRKNK